MIRFGSVASLSLALLISGVLLGCGGESDVESEWTVQEGAIEFTETLRAGDDEDYFFGEIGGIAVRDDGQIFVSDEQASHVKLLSPDGTLRDSIGRAGQGPGEFNRPEQIHFGANDSLYIMDGYRSELSVFGPDLGFARRIGLSLSPEERTFLSPGTVMVMHNEPGFLVLYSQALLPGTEDRKGYAIRRVTPAGRVGDTVLTTPPREMHVEQGDDFVRYRGIPFARSPFAPKGPNHSLHYAWSDSLGVRTVAPDGSLKRTIDIPFDPVPVTDADREEALEGRPEESVNAVEDKIPPTKPAFDQFLVDPQGRYWFGRPTAHPDTTNWWVAWPEEKRVATGTLPSDVQLELVKDGRVYGRSETEAGAPVVVRYRVGVE